MRKIRKVSVAGALLIVCVVLTGCSEKLMEAKKADETVNMETEPAIVLEPEQMVSSEPELLVSPEKEQPVSSETKETEKIQVQAENSQYTDRLSFSGDQMYAAAYLGYQEMTNLEYYREQYLHTGEEPTVYFVSSGDYYLVIPRYSGMEMELYQTDIETMEQSLTYTEKDCQPFIVQCNASDIFADAEIRLYYQDQTAVFSPFISLKDGSIEVGEKGLDITGDESDRL